MAVCSCCAVFLACALRVLIKILERLSYYAGIVLDANFASLSICSKLCRHNWHKPREEPQSWPRQSNWTIPLDKSFVDDLEWNGVL